MNQHGSKQIGKIGNLVGKKTSPKQWNTKTALAPVQIRDGAFEYEANSKDREREGDTEIYSEREGENDSRRVD